MSDLRERQEMFERLFDSAPDALLLTNEAGTITAINRQSEALFGYSREELVGKSVEVLIPDNLRDGHRSHREQYFHAPKVRPMGRGLNLSARRKDGTLCPVDLTLSPMRSKDGNVVLTAVRDITEQRTAQEAIQRQNAQLESANKELDALMNELRERQEMFERLFDSALDALLLTNEAGRITAINRQSEALFGYSREELVGKSVEVLVPEDLRGRHSSHREQYFHAPTVRPMGRGLNLST
jgi:PAS domain S-box-containing protein